MGPIWGRQDPGGPHGGPINLAIWAVTKPSTPLQNILFGNVSLIQWSCFKFHPVLSRDVPRQEHLLDAETPIIRHHTHKMIIWNVEYEMKYSAKLCASFQSHGWIQTGITVRKHSSRAKIGDFLPRVALKFIGWSWRTIWHLFYTTSSFVHHFKAVGEFKLELQSGNIQFGSKLAIFCPMWPWNLTNWPRKTIGHFFYAASNFVHHFIAISEFKLELQSGNTQFVSKSMIFYSRVTLKWRMTDDLEKE